MNYWFFPGGLSTPVPYRIMENAPILKIIVLLGSQLSCLQKLLYAILQNSDFKTGF